MWRPQNITEGQQLVERLLTRRRFESQTIQAATPSSDRLRNAVRPAITTQETDGDDVSSVSSQISDPAKIAMTSTRYRYDHPGRGEGGRRPNE